MSRPDPAHLRAVIFDVDGTLAETERDGHRPAFNRAFADQDLPYSWSIAEYGELLKTTGGRERLRRYLVQQGHTDDADALASTLHRTKTEHFLEWVRSGAVQSRPGVAQLMAELHASGIAIAIATTGTRAWVLPLLKVLFSRVEFAAVVTGDDVTRLKPDPQAYRLALTRLGLPAAEAVAIEDSPPGLAAAHGAGLRCLIVTSEYTGDAAFPFASAIVREYGATPASDSTPGYLRDGVTVAALRHLQAGQ